MPQSLANIVLHVVFSTKNRDPWLVPPVSARLHAYLASVVRSAGCECSRAGGANDHVHLAVRLSRTIAVASLIETVKVLSSKWLKGESMGMGTFAWQRGYDAFSTSPARLSALLGYIDNQELHHRTRTFQDEYREILRRAGVSFDERYVWD